jgi:hypothetical protein
MAPARATCALALWGCVVYGAYAGVDDRIMVGVEHQTISSAQWTVGSLGASLAAGSGKIRYNWYTDVRQGGGDDGTRPFHYAIETAGMLATYQQSLTIQVEDRQIDVETTHGNLPKLGASYLWNGAVLTSVAYAYSIDGNLGTRLLTAQVRDIARSWQPLAGLAYGQAAPAILDLQPGVIPPSRTLKEGYLGFSLPHSWEGGEWSVLADYLGLGNIRRGTLTLTYTHDFHKTGA